MMIWKGENGGYLVEFEDAVLQGGNEDATVSFGTLVQQWANFRSRHPGIHSTHLRTDGAACYAGAEFARLLPTAYEACGMRVLSHSIGEGGPRKGQTKKKEKFQAWRVRYASLCVCGETWVSLSNCLSCCDG